MLRGVNMVVKINFLIVKSLDFMILHTVLSKIGHGCAMAECGGGFTYYHHHTTVAKRILYGGP